MARNFNDPERIPGTGAQGRVSVSAIAGGDFIPAPIDVGTGANILTPNSEEVYVGDVDGIRISIEFTVPASELGAGAAVNVQSFDGAAWDAGISVPIAFAFAASGTQRPMGILLDTRAMEKVRILSVSNTSVTNAMTGVMVSWNRQ